MVFRIQNGDRELPPLNSRAIEKYCDKLLSIIDDNAKSEAAFRRWSNTTVRSDKNGPWSEQPHRTRSFTTALIEAVSEERATGGLDRVNFWIRQMV